MLLKMRGVPPKTAARAEDGVLYVPASSNGGGSSAAGNGNGAEDGVADEAARAWYEAVGVSVGVLAERREARFEAQDWASWELKFVGRILGGGL